MTYWLHPDAEAQMGEATVHDARHASEMIALAFLAEFERVLGLIVENPKRGPHAEASLRVYHFDRFPSRISVA